MKDGFSDKLLNWKNNLNVLINELEKDCVYSLAILGLKIEYNKIN
jgi:hypothetical protein